MAYHCELSLRKLFIGSQMDSVTPAGHEVPTVLYDIWAGKSATCTAAMSAMVCLEQDSIFRIVWTVFLLLECLPSKTKETNISWYVSHFWRKLHLYIFQKGISLDENKTEATATWTRCTDFTDAFQQQQIQWRASEMAEDPSLQSWVFPGLFYSVSFT